VTQGAVAAETQQHDEQQHDEQHEQREQ